ncbi:MAG: UDP-N-acetylglucosamine 1-carboxyvinyltransferase [Betaproteobacteria bacterium]
MERLVITGGRRLVGQVVASGAKNSALPLMAATLLTEETCILERVPLIRDVETMIRVVQALGSEVRWEDEHVLRLRSGAFLACQPPDELVREMRASVQVVGPLLARLGAAVTTTPGGCALGPRPINLHIQGLRAMGAEVEEDGPVVHFRAKRLHGADILLDYPSVGATENLMTAACLADGRTFIRNAAREPEIVDLQSFLNQMGARVRGAGTDIIRVDGVARLHGAHHVVIPDRIEIGTYLAAAAITRGDVTVSDVIPQHCEAALAKLADMGAEVTRQENGVRAKAGWRLRGTTIRALPYPGFPTDLQPQFTSVACLAEGISFIHEEVFSSRFKHVEELMRMGADIRIEGRVAVIQGVEYLTGTTVHAPDLRAGAALVLAALGARGESVVENANHLDRGYEDLPAKLTALGAEVKTIPAADRPSFTTRVTA